MHPSGMPRGERTTYHGNKGKTIAEIFKDAVKLARQRAFLDIQNKTERITDQFRTGLLTQEEFRDALMNLMDEAINVMEKV